jgi:small neutral amino acid transporter SnatA (MarC family)
MRVLTATLLLLLVMDPAGNVLTFVLLLKDIAPPRRRWIILREMVIALGILLIFLLFGRYFLAALRISEASLSISGGVILLLIALRMIFHTSESVFGECSVGEPLIVPLATPLVAGPSVIATVTLLTTREPGQLLQFCQALVLAWFVTALVLLCGNLLSRLLGPRVLTALERVMGMLLITLAVEMALEGVRAFLRSM